MPDGKFQIFFLEIIYDRMQSEKNKIRKQRENRKAVKKKRKQHCAEMGEERALPKSLGERHHVREYGDQIACGKKKTHVTAERQCAGSHGAGDGG